MCTDHGMFRYLLKYVGKYSVLADYVDDVPRDENGDLNKYFDDFYIPCKSGIVIKNTYFDNLLAIWFYEKPAMGKRYYNMIKSKYKDIFLQLDDSSDDVIILFNADDIEKIATIVKPKKKQKNVDPIESLKLVKGDKVKYNIPQSDSMKLRGAVKELPRKGKKKFLDNLGYDYINEVMSKKNKGFNIKVELNKSGLGIREYIHSKDLWDGYIDYVETHK